MGFHPHRVCYNSDWWLPTESHNISVPEAEHFPPWEKSHSKNTTKVSDGLAIQQRRRHMFGRSRLLSMVFEMGSAVSAVFGVVGALIVFGYFPSAIALVVLVSICVFYLPATVKRWLAGLEKNEKDHETLRNMLKEAGSDSDSAEIHVHAERLRIRAKNKSFASR